MHRHQRSDPDEYLAEENWWLYSRPASDWKDGRRYQDEFGETFKHHLFEVAEGQIYDEEVPWGVFDDHLWTISQQHLWLHRKMTWTNNYSTGPVYFNKVLCRIHVYDHVIIEEIDASS